MGEDSKIRCYDCHDLSVPYNLDSDHIQSVKGQ